MNNPKIAIFAYNFPHKKTQEFVFNLIANGYKIDLILAANPVKLNIPPNLIRSKINHKSLLDPKKIAENFQIPYYVVEHNSEETISLLKDFEIDLAIISGARILKKKVIEACKLGILNIHPALLPECKGLDSLFWSVEKDIPLGNTSHLIDSGVDSGKIVLKNMIEIFEDDTILDLTERIFESQISMLTESIEILKKSDVNELQSIPSTVPHNHKMTPEEEMNAYKKLPLFISKYKKVLSK